jgi:hypothetical protein
MGVDTMTNIIEYIIDGGFETGNFSSNFVPYNTSIMNNSSIAHSGNYCTFGHYQTTDAGFVYNFTPEVLANLIKRFNFWAKCEYGTYMIDSYIFYDDNSYTVVSTLISSSWHNINLLPYLEINKYVTNLVIDYNSIWCLENPTVNPLVYFDDFTCVSINNGNNHITISNISASLNCEALSFSGKHSCSVAKRKVPMRPEGEVIDSGTYIIKASSIKFTVRLTDVENNVLKYLYNSKTEITITTTQDDDINKWVYIGRFTSFPNNYEIAYDGELLREWITELEFMISSISYEPIE